MAIQPFPPPEYPMPQPLFVTIEAQEEADVQSLVFTCAVRFFNFMFDEELTSWDIERATFVVKDEALVAAVRRSVEAIPFFVTMPVKFEVKPAAQKSVSLQVQILNNPLTYKE